MVIYGRKDASEDARNNQSSGEDTWTGGEKGASHPRRDRQIRPCVARNIALQISPGNRN